MPSTPANIPPLEPPDAVANPDSRPSEVSTSSGALTCLRERLASREQMLLRALGERPVLLVPSFLAHGMITVLAGVLLAGLLLAVPHDNGWVTHPGSAADGLILAFNGSFVCASLVVWGHFLLGAHRAFTYAVAPAMTSRAAARIVQLVGSATLAFAVLHYYVALLSDPGAYAGMLAPTPERGWCGACGVLDRLMFIPSTATVVDCLYFSAATMTTVGYGDIHPASTMAKLVTVTEMMAAFTLIVVILGGVLGRSDSDHPS